MNRFANGIGDCYKQRKSKAFPVIWGGKAAGAPELKVRGSSPLGNVSHNTLAERYLACPACVGQCGPEVLDNTVAYGFGSDWRLHHAPIEVQNTFVLSAQSQWPGGSTATSTSASTERPRA